MVGVGGKRSTERFRERYDGCAALSRLRRDSVMEADTSDSLERALELSRDEELDAIERTRPKILMRMRELRYGTYYTGIILVTLEYL